MFASSPSADMPDLITKTHNLHIKSMSKQCIMPLSTASARCCHASRSLRRVEGGTDFLPSQYAAGSEGVRLSFSQSLAATTIVTLERGEL